MCWAVNLLYCCKIKICFWKYYYNASATWYSWLSTPHQSWYRLGVRLGKRYLRSIQFRVRRLMVGAKNAWCCGGIDSPPVQHSMRKQPHATRRKQAEMSVRRPLVTFRKEYWKRVQTKLNWVRSRSKKPVEKTLQSAHHGNNWKLGKNNEKVEKGYQK